MKKLVKIEYNNGKHDYKEYPEQTWFKAKILSETSAKQVLFNIDGKKFKLESNGEFPTMKEVDFLEVKLSSMFGKLITAGQYKFAGKLLKIAELSVEKIISDIRVKTNNPKIQRIKELKSQQFVSEKDKAMIQVLWWEAKREVFLEFASKLRVDWKPEEIPISISAVEKELTSRIMKAIKEYKGFPETRD